MQCWECNNLYNFYGFGVVYSYVEHKKFEASAALEGGSSKSESFLQNNSIDGLTLAIADNIDTIISSQDGKRKNMLLSCC